MLLTCLLLILPFLPLHFYFLLFSPFMSHMPLRRWTINFMPRFTKRIVSQKKEKKLKWKSIFGIVYVAFYVHIAFLSLQLTRHSWAHSAFKISSKEIDRKMTAFPPTYFLKVLNSTLKHLRWQELSHQPQITENYHRQLRHFGVQTLEIQSDRLEWNFMTEV